MKNAILAIALMMASTIALGQRIIPTATRYCPTMQNQVTAEDAKNDEFGMEYTERKFQGLEEDTASLNAQFRKLEAIQERNMIPAEKQDGPNLEEIYWMNMDDMEKIRKEEEEKKAAEEKSRSIIKPN